MRIMVSACLTGKNCKYNGGNSLNSKVMDLFVCHEIIPVCPEVMGGLPTPRVPAEVVSVYSEDTPAKSEKKTDHPADACGLSASCADAVIRCADAGVQRYDVVTRDGISVGEEYRLGAEKCLEIALREQPDLIILQSRSPSCGVNQRYDGTFSGRLINAPGVTAELLIRHGFRVMDVEDLS